MDLQTIKDVFVRINSTNYALNAMEVHNARFDGEFKQFGEKVADTKFFEKHGVFSASEIQANAGRQVLHRIGGDDAFDVLQ